MKYVRPEITVYTDADIAMLQADALSGCGVHNSCIIHIICVCISICFFAASR